MNSLNQGGSMTFSHNDTLGWQRESNENYNEIVYRRWGISPSGRGKKRGGLADGTHNQTVWFRNLNRLIDMVDSREDLSDFSFLDLGSGDGLATLYAAENYPFRDFLGLEVDPELIPIARRNLEVLSSKMFLATGLKVSFLEGDAASFRIDESKRYFIFMFNPFGLSTLCSFYETNAAVLANNKSVLAYANDLHLENFLSRSSAVVYRRDSLYNLSLSSF